MKYTNLCDIYLELESTTKRLKKTFIIAKLIKKTKTDELPVILLLMQGRLFPAWDDTKIGFSERYAIKAINIATGRDVKEIENEFNKKGDLGLVAEEFTKRKKQASLVSKELTTKKVHDNLTKLAKIEGPGSVDIKIKLVAELLTSARPIEARYIIRTVLEQMRVGVGSGSMRDAIVWAEFDYYKKYNDEEDKFELTEEERKVYNEYVETVQEAYDKTNDFSKVVKIVREKGLKAVKAVDITLGKPVKVMLFQKVKDMKEAFKTVGKPAALEFKYDGFRMQIHIKDTKITIFTRRLENVTKQFPDVVRFVKEHITAKNVILDCEAVGYDKKTKKYIAFQRISQRIKRKYDIEQMSRDYPVELNIFDILYYKDESIIKMPFKDRRKILERIIREPKAKQIVLAKQIVTDNLKEADEFYKRSLAAGNEGVMVKALDKPYKPGSRVGYGVKVKPIMETLDLVIVGAQWGEGKRAKWLTSYKLACRDRGKYLTIGKVGTGFKELQGSGVSFNDMTKLLKKNIISEKGKTVEVKPDVVIEIAYEEIQKSPTYTSGYALRFPRVVRLREDRAPRECSSLSEVKRLYEEQRGRGK
ncbi:DNA ligase [Candidatus Woesearchaeota archaeon]|nr:MAG: DNA ligase [Candidatus Woesearchaeota archaeon]